MSSNNRILRHRPIGKIILKKAQALWLVFKRLVTSDFKPGAVPAHLR